MTCSFDGCDSPGYIRKLCHGHYRQFLLGRELTTKKIFSPYPPEYRDDNDYKYCPVCKTFKPVGLFNKSKDKVDGLDRKCGRCAVGIMRKSNFGISQDQYDQMLIDSSGTCDLCEEPFRNVPREPVVDHDHRCCPTQKTCGGCVRGLVHRSCNSFLGLANDDEQTLLKAVDYLRRNRGK